MNDRELEARLRARYRARSGETETAPLSLRLDVAAIPRNVTAPPRLFGRGRGMTLLAAAALLLVGGAWAVSSGILRLPTVVSPVPEPSVLVVATPRGSAAPSANPIPVAGPGGVWIPTGTMVTPRDLHTAVRLQDGRVLVVGGLTGPERDYLTSAELYDPATGTWSPAGSIAKPLVAATLLRDGKVLVLVGDPNGGPRRAEVFDPASGTWTATGPMDPGAEESDDTFTVLRDGRVLLAGREGARVYDPASGTWTLTRPMVRSSGGGGTLLQDGRVLDIFGAQLYDPANGTWTATGKKNNQGSGAGAALLSDGKVLVAGGRAFTTSIDGKSIDEHDLDSAEVYDPVTGSWTAIANMHAKAQTTTAFVQPDGKVLVVGSHSAEVYDPATGTWTELPVRPGIRFGAATLLSDGSVLVTGNTDAEQPACTADLYDPHTGSWTTATASALGCGGARSFTLLLDGTVLVAGGSSGAAELYIPAGVSLPPLPAFPSPPPPAFPSPTPVPTRLPPAAGPVPPNARSWTVTVDNRSSEPAALFVADQAWDGLRLVGSATPNVVPAGATLEVTFLFPVDGGWIYVNPRPGDAAALVSAADIGIPGKILIRAEGGAGWLSP